MKITRILFLLLLTIGFAACSNNKDEDVKPVNSANMEGRYAGNVYVSVPGMDSSQDISVKDSLIVMPADKNHINLEFTPAEIMGGAVAKNFVVKKIELKGTSEEGQYKLYAKGSLEGACDIAGDHLSGFTNVKLDGTYNVMQKTIDFTFSFSSKNMPHNVIMQFKGNKISSMQK